jgi:hypothetical protein
MTAALATSDTVVAKCACASGRAGARVAPGRHGTSLAEIRATLGMSDTTLMRLIREHGIAPANPDAAALRRSHRAYLRRN